DSSVIASEAKQSIGSARLSRDCFVASSPRNDAKGSVRSVTPKDLHFYEPKNGHGLKHDPFNAIIAPRPIGWISSRDGSGHVQLAPIRFFHPLCYHTQSIR